jgi:hypothetical protein
MEKRAVLPFLLILVGAIIGFLVIVAYAMGGGKPGITLVFLSVSVICILVGSILAFSRLLDRSLKPIMDEIQRDIEDDIQDVKQHRMTNTIWMLIIISLSLLIFSFFVFRFHKMEAMWGPVPVLIPTMLGLFALAYFIPRTRWFRDMSVYTPMWIFIIPTLGFILTLWLGLSKTENMGLLRVPQQAVAGYNTYQATGILLQAGEVGSNALDFNIPDCDGDACAIVLVILLVALVFVLVIGSAMIPHFWLLSGSIMLGIMVLIAVHDLRLRRPIKAESQLVG